MTAKLNPYISFNGNAREAMEFYEHIFGGDLTLNTYGEYGPPDAPERRQDHARHARDGPRLHAHGRRRAARHRAAPWATTSW